MPWGGGGTVIRFTKMEGAGNDYIYINNLVEQIPEERLSALARAVSDRHFGVGADGLIVILPPTEPGYDFRFRMFNADGSEGEMCGNGMRCFARYCFDRGLTDKRAFRVQALAGCVVPEVLLDAAGEVAAVRVDLGEPRGLGEQRVAAAGREYRVITVNTGVPHIVIFADDVESVDLAAVGPLLERHPGFPTRVNVNFAQVLSRSEVRARTWERGSGITLACGTGGSAVLVAACLLGHTGRQARIRMPGGDLQVEWDEATNHVFLTGPATFVCDGVFLKEI